MEIEKLLEEIAKRAELVFADKDIELVRLFQKLIQIGIK